jgi:hypothetical protein
VNELAHAVRLVAVPVAVVLTAILPELLAEAVLHAIEKLAGVDSPVAEGDRSVLLSLVVVDHLGGDAALARNDRVVRRHH